MKKTATTELHLPPERELFNLKWIVFKMNNDETLNSLNVKYRRLVTRGGVDSSWIVCDTAIPANFCPLDEEFKPPIYHAAPDDAKPLQYQRFYTSIEAETWAIAEYGFLRNVSLLERVRKITQLGSGDISIKATFEGRKSDARLLLDGNSRQPGTEGIELQIEASDQIKEHWENLEDQIYELLFCGVKLEFSEIAIDF